MSTPFCARCGNPARCACAPAQFDQEWIRPYVVLPAPATRLEPGIPAPPTAWYVSPPGPPGPAPEDHALPATVVLSAAGGHRARKPRRRHRPLGLTAALATLIGSATLAGAYALSRDQDTRNAASPPPASRLDVSDGEQPAAEPLVQSPPGTRGPAEAQPTAPSARTGPAGQRRSPVPSASPPASPGVSAVPSGPPSAPAQEGPGTVPSPGTPSATPAAPTLGRHDTGPEVVELQRRLAQLGAWSLPQRGRYDGHVQEAVSRFQARHGVRGDLPGVYGPATRKVLQSLTS
ncbi:peptidoglycan-binding domain-containing protein [Streptomyces goshikiensis]|uniref:peptidoglycan-binding domain-containing protein n=1 Tax=Streptomyces goshikiensis TaxID=1942 RepID=UPI0036978018